MVGNILVILFYFLGSSLEEHGGQGAGFNNVHHECVFVCVKNEGGGNFPLSQDIAVYMECNVCKVV